MKITGFQAVCLVIAAIAFGMLVAGPSPFTSTNPVGPENTDLSTNLLPPCVEEDSPNCYWDASERGNGLGNDVVNP